MRYDYVTSTIDGAEAFDRANSEYWDELSRDACDPEEVEPSEDDMEECSCSDPGCPCYGIKKGWL